MDNDDKKQTEAEAAQAEREKGADAQYDSEDEAALSQNRPASATSKQGATQE